MDLEFFFKTIPVLTLSKSIVDPGDHYKVTG
jgi:hypothetical protein